MSSKQIELRLNNLPLASFVDGHQLSVNRETGELDVVFFQINPLEAPEKGILNGAATAHVRLSLAQAKKLIEDMTKNINDFENK